MKALSLILKIIMLVLASIWGLGCGIIFPAVIMSAGGDIVSEELANDPVMVVWLVSAAVGAVVPAILVMCGLCKTASVMSLAGFCGILYVYARFAQLNPLGNSGPTELYMPCTFVTLLVLCVTVIENRENIKAYFDKKAEEKEREAPSIFSDRKDD